MKDTSLSISNINKSENLQGLVFIKNAKLLFNIKIIWNIRGIYSNYLKSNEISQITKRFAIWGNIKQNNIKIAGVTNERLKQVT